MKNSIFIIGTRPEITKIAPIASKTKFKILFTGQHFSKGMSEDFFQLFKNNDVINLNLKKFKNFGNNERYLVNVVVENLKKINPNKIIVQGDTNSTLIGAIASKALNKQLYFIESGMRSRNILQPEEYNRIIVSHLADINFCNHALNQSNLLKEGISKKKTYISGSTVYASVNAVEKDLDSLSNMNYILLTLHRPENVDNIKRLISIMKTINSLNVKIIFPIHPRTKKNLQEYNLNLFKNIKFIKPQKYSDFLKLLKNSNFIISDSGGLQEEAAIFRKPLLIPRSQTERPEMLNIFNVLVKSNQDLFNESLKILNNTSVLSDSVIRSSLLYGKEEVVDKILNVIEK